MSRLNTLMGAALVSTALASPAIAFAETTVPLCVEANTSTGYALPSPKAFTLASLPTKRPQSPDLCITPTTQRLLTPAIANRIMSVYDGLSGGFANSEVLPPLSARFKAKGKAIPEMEISSSGPSQSATGENMIYFFTVTGAKGEFVTGQMRLSRESEDNKSPSQTIPQLTPEELSPSHPALMI